MKRLKYTYTISNLQEFITKMEKLSESGSYYFRGEPKDYGKTKNMASGYRWMNNNRFCYSNESPQFSHERSLSDLWKMRKLLFYELGYSLSEKEIENFITYAQHHGLPTELLDITENPLVSLYFSCLKVDTDDYGVVYAFNKKSFSELPYGLSIINSDIDKQNFNLFDSVRKHDSSESGPGFDELLSLRNRRRFQEPDGEVLYFERRLGREVVAEVMVFVESLFFQNPELLYKFINGNPNESEVVANTELLKVLNEGKNLEFETFEKIEKNLCLPLYSLSWDLFNDILRVNEMKETGSIYLIRGIKSKDWHDSIDYDIFPCFIHKPSVRFDRMVNQQGAFIIQQYFGKSWKVDKHVQKIKPDITFIINNKENILKQLDSIGINRKFLFPDPDNIGRYISDKIADEIPEDLYF